MSFKRAAIGSVVLLLFALLPPRGGCAATAARDEVDAGRNVVSQSSGYTIGATVVGSAGSPGASTSYSMNGTLGQSTPIGIGSAGGTILRAGFWGRIYAPTGVDETPPAFRLLQNYPNPFNPATNINFSIAAPCAVDLTIYDVAGRRIKRLVHEARAAGRYVETWNGTNDRGARVATGIYFYRLRAGAFVSVKKMVLLK